MKVFGKNVFNELRDNVKSIKKVYLAKNFNEKDIINFIKDNNNLYLFDNDIEYHYSEKKGNGEIDFLLPQCNNSPYIIFIVLLYYHLNNFVQFILY